MFYGHFQFISVILRFCIYSQYIGTWLIFGFLFDIASFDTIKFEPILIQSTKSPNCTLRIQT